MLPDEQTTQSLSKTPKGRKLGAHQKACPKCQRIIHADLPRCPSCAYSPWRWQPNTRFLVATVIIALFLLVLIPILTATDRSYRVPVSTTTTP